MAQSRISRHSDRSGLGEYRRKRHFERTPEPRGEVESARSSYSFVIHKHAARQLHYDLRLELDGVLKSWAVPKGPSLDPHDRHLAVHVEDHPLEYGSFEGIIPAGEYGGGTVMLWDRGTWAPLGDAAADYRAGRVKFRLMGEKLRGAWMLVRMARRSEEEGRENWLLFKERDEEARPVEEYDVRSVRPESVATGRSMEEIAAEADAVWSTVSPPAEAAKSRAGADRRSTSPRAARRAGSRERQAGKTGSRRSSSDDVGNLPHARAAAQPREFMPQLATLVNEVPEGDEWLHEIKFDGYRMLAFVERGRARLVSRSGNDWTKKFPTLAAAVERLGISDAVLDGEVVVVRPDGSTDFQALQNAMKGGSRANLAWYLFDVPHCGGCDLTRTPLLERKEFLRHMLAAAGAGAARPVDPTARAPAGRASVGGLLRYSDHIRGRGGQVFRQACGFAVEGLVSKRADSAYESRRTRTWLKIKCRRRQEFVIGGYTDPAGARTGFGALLLGYYAGGQLRYCGKVGTGFSEKSLKEILRELKSRAQPKPAFANPPRGAEARRAHWVRPELVAEVVFSEWTSDDILRQPSFQGLWLDKDAREVVREKPQGGNAESGNVESGKGAAAPDAGEQGKSPNTAPRAARRKTTAQAERRPVRARNGRRSGEVALVAGVRITNPEKVLYPEREVTKRGLAQYYEQIADHILPHIVNRPITIVRCPEGWQSDCFYQKHQTEMLGTAIRGVTIRDKEGEGAFIVIDDLRGLITLVQFGALEIHPWGARADDVEHPDRMTFDLDPGPGVEWPTVVAAARRVRDRLSELGLESFVKTSGGKGLHVVAPLSRRPEWGELREFTEGVARGLAREEPERYVANMAKARRTGRIYIDYLRNNRAAHAVAAYSTRAREGAPVSAPLEWSELKPRVTADAFNVTNMPRRLARKGDPWAEYFRVRQGLTAAMRKEAR
ncbi:MAG: DNA ligase D [Planctomycetota bacterium]